MDGFRPMRRANPILFALPTKRKAFRPPPPKLKEGWRVAILSGGVTPVWSRYVVSHLKQLDLAVPLRPPVLLAEADDHHRLPHLLDGPTGLGFNGVVIAYERKICDFVIQGYS